MTDATASSYRLKIHDLPASDRPRERLQHAGAGALSNAELLAIILRLGRKGENALQMAQRLLSSYRGLSGLAQASFGELALESGMGAAKSAQVQAALELGRRLLVASPDERPQVSSPADAANLLLPEMGLLENEHLRTLLLDSKHRVLASPTIYIGNVNTSVIRVSELFREAIRLNCPALIVAHNHPSGDPTPSPDDVRVTEQIVQAGKLLDIEVLDHLVIGRQRYVSLKERGLGFAPAQGGT
jgi:DNA repair protein RadC